MPKKIEVKRAEALGRLLNAKWFDSRAYRLLKLQGELDQTVLASARAKWEECRALDIQFLEGKTS